MRSCLVLRAGVKVCALMKGGLVLMKAGLVLICLSTVVLIFVDLVWSDSLQLCHVGQTDYSYTEMVKRSTVML